MISVTVVPQPRSWSTLTGISRTRHATPLIPNPLSPRAPIRLATAVPCPSPSAGSPSWPTVSAPCTSSTKPFESSSHPVARDLARVGPEVVAELGIASCRCPSRAPRRGRRRRWRCAQAAGTRALRSAHCRVKSGSLGDATPLARKRRFGSTQRTPGSLRSRRAVALPPRTTRIPGATRAPGAALAAAACARRSDEQRGLSGVSAGRREQQKTEQRECCQPSSPRRSNANHNPAWSACTPIREGRIPGFTAFRGP